MYVRHPGEEPYVETIVEVDDTTDMVIRVPVSSALSVEQRHLFLQKVSETLRGFAHKVESIALLEVGGKTYAFLPTD